jgi:DNA segregation ATPase FtsK/SpoIIIE-like protein
MAVIGMADGGRPVMVKFSAAHTGHVLVAGQPGAGKTCLLRTIAVSLALTNRQSDCQLQIMDPLAGAAGGPDRSPLLPLAYLPHMLTDPALGIEACADQIHFLAEEMAYRRRERVQSPRIIVLLDHALAYLENARPSAAANLLRLLQYGPQAGIHFVIATDRPESPFLDSTIKATISKRIVGRLADAGVARKVAGTPLDQAALLYGEGDFLLLSGDEVTYFQAAYIGDYDLHLVLNNMLYAPRPRLLARPYSARPRVAPVASSGSAPRSFSLRDGVVDLTGEADFEAMEDS